MTAEIGLTELETFEPSRMDGVQIPANGFPVLLMKSLQPGEQEKERAEHLTAANSTATDAPDAKDGAEQTVTKTETETSAATAPQNDEVAKGDLIKAAITEAIKPFEDKLKAVEADIAKVLSTAVPGGPVQTVPANIRAQRERDESLAKAARYERLAEEVSEPDIKSHYQRLAAAARAVA
jgi:hypothetical protein